VAGELHAACAEVLAAAVAILDTDAPERRYVSNGPPAADCEQLVVYFSLVDVLAPGSGGMPGIPSPAAPLVYRATIVVERWVPGCPGAPPPTEGLEGEAEVAGIEGWEVFCRMRAMLQFLGSEACRFLAVSQLAPTGATGDLVGWRFSVLTELGGWRA
jgi:hypothetical protein